MLLNVEKERLLRLNDTVRIRPFVATLRRIKRAAYVRNRPRGRPPGLTYFSLKEDFLHKKREKNLILVDFNDDHHNMRSVRVPG